MDNSKPTKMDKEARRLAIAIVNHLNSEFNLELKTVDAAAMTDDVSTLLESKERKVEELKKEVERLSSELAFIKHYYIGGV